MIDKLMLLLPEIVVFTGAVVVSIVGLSKTRSARDLSPIIAMIALVGAFIATPFAYSDENIAAAGLLMPGIGQFVKMMVCAVGVLLVMVNNGLIDRQFEAAVASGRTTFDPIRATRGEFWAFFLLSLMGVMLCCNANDLIWLFLALELTSLPTYVMVAMSRGSRKAQEAAVKYFFLGALAAAIFLYGFALLYGATGTIVLTEMHDVFRQQALSDAGISSLGMVGMILAILGVSFKIAAAPLHFYAADVYEGAASPVTAFLAFVPKVAGIIALMTLLSTLGWSDHYGLDAAGVDIAGLPKPILTTLWMVAVLTMTLGNVAALLQRSVKRMLAYSSIAHSGYMIIGLIAGPGNGLNAVLFYLFAYGIMNTAAFAVLAGLERRGHEIESLDDLAGLRVRHPMMAAVVALSAGSLMGLPPLLGFWGKLYLFIAGVQAGHITLIVIAGLNSAISCWYYLGMVRQVLLEKPSPQAETIVPSASAWPRLAAILTAVGILVLPFFTDQLVDCVEDSMSAPDTATATAEVTPATPEPDGDETLRTAKR